MQVTKELLLQDVGNLERQLEGAKASVSQITGALATLKGVIAFIDKEEAPVKKVKGQKNKDKAAVVVEEKANG